MKILVLIPAKDEGQKIVDVVSEVKKIGYDVLVVDDGSSDATSAAAREAGAMTIRHVVNRGQGAALRTGIAFALKDDYEAVVFFDADGQMAAEEISHLVDLKEKTSCDVVLGSRFLGKALDMPLSKNITLKLGLLFTRLTTGLRLTDVHNGFQLWSVGALSKIELRQDRQAYASEVLQQIVDKKLSYQEIPVTITYTAYSKAKGQSIFNAFAIVWNLIIKK